MAFNHNHIRSTMKAVNKIGLVIGIIILSFVIFLTLEISGITNFVDYTPPEFTGNGVIPTGSIFAIQILNDSFQEGNPDYKPDVAVVSHGDTIQWTNEDSTMHTVTSKSDFGKMFDSGSMNPEVVFTLNTSDFAVGEYEYFCVVHPWMVATLVIEESKEGA